MMTDLPSSQRTFLRRKILALRNQLRSEQRVQLERQFHGHILTLPAVQHKQSFFVYCSYQSEMATGTLIDHLLSRGKTVCIPCTEPTTKIMQAVTISCPHTDLVFGYKGIPELAPSLVSDRIYPPELIEVALIPGSVFDRRGYRLGYGGGYYDRFLALAAPQAMRIGLAFSFQVVARIPQLPHDVPMDVLVTEKEIFRWSRDTAPGEDYFFPTPPCL